MDSSGNIYQIGLSDGSIYDLVDKKSTVTETGEGNSVTGIVKNSDNGNITVTKGKTFSETTHSHNTLVSGSESETPLLYADASSDSPNIGYKFDAIYPTIDPDAEIGGVKVNPRRINLGRDDYRFNKLYLKNDLMITSFGSLVNMVTSKDTLDERYGFNNTYLVDSDGDFENDADTIDEVLSVAKSYYDSQRVYIKFTKNTSSSLSFKGNINISSFNSLENPSSGDCYMATEAGTYGNIECAVGDVFYCDLSAVHAKNAVWSRNVETSNVMSYKGEVTQLDFSSISNPEPGDCYTASENGTYGGVVCEANTIIYCTKGAETVNKASWSKNVDESSVLKYRTRISVANFENISSPTAGYSYIATEEKSYANIDCKVGSIFYCSVVNGSATTSTWSKHVNATSVLNIKSEITVSDFNNLTDPVAGDCYLAGEAGTYGGLQCSKNDIFYCSTGAMSSSSATWSKSVSTRSELNYKGTITKSEFLLISSISENDCYIADENATYGNIYCYAGNAFYCTSASSTASASTWSKSVSKNTEFPDILGTLKAEDGTISDLSVKPSSSILEQHPLPAYEVKTAGDYSFTDYSGATKTISLTRSHVVIYLSDTESWTPSIKWIFYKQKYTPCDDNFSTNRHYLDCSSYMAMVVGGIPYKKSPFYSYKRALKSFYAWGLIFRTLGIRSAGQIGQLMSRYGRTVKLVTDSNGNVVKNSFIYAKPGDLLFFAAEEETEEGEYILKRENRFLGISHIGMITNVVVENGEVTTLAYTDCTGSRGNTRIRGFYGKSGTWYGAYVDSDEEVSTVVEVARPNYGDKIASALIENKSNGSKLKYRTVSTDGELDIDAFGPFKTDDTVVKKTNLGTSSNPFGNLYLSGNITCNGATFGNEISVTGNVTASNKLIGKTLDVSENGTIDGTLTVGDNLTSGGKISGKTLDISGNTTIGSSSSNTVTVNAKLYSLTASKGTKDNQVATTAFVTNAVSDLVEQEVESQLPTALSDRLKTFKIRSFSVAGNGTSYSITTTGGYIRGLLFTCGSGGKLDSLFIIRSNGVGADDNIVLNTIYSSESSQLLFSTSHVVDTSKTLTIQNNSPATTSYPNGYTVYVYLMLFNGIFTELE